MPQWHQLEESDKINTLNGEVTSKISERIQEKISGVLNTLQPLGMKKLSPRHVLKSRILIKNICIVSLACS